MGGATHPCPLCSNPTTTSVAREALPVFQNVTYSTREEAVSVPLGSFRLATCTCCGFSHNCEFEPDLITYDGRYDNHVESKVFGTYYRQLAELMHDKFDLAGGFVYDIGCGTGKFLETLCSGTSDVFGIGIDPSCTPSSTDSYRLVQDTFGSYHIEPNTRLVLLRHVLEHIGDPIAFLKDIRNTFPDTTLFVEVPDFDWILANRAFWDLSYEHCNYFTSRTLRFALETAGFEVIDQQPSFGSQYQWATCTPSDLKAAPVCRAETALATVTVYANAETERLASIHEMAENTRGLALWGMASKGVILAVLLPEGSLVGGIDMNRGKQGRFAATTGLQIHPPEWLLTKPGVTVAIMNPNYAEEISILLHDLNAEVDLTQI